MLTDFISYENPPVLGDLLQLVDTFDGSFGEIFLVSNVEHIPSRHGINGAYAPPRYIVKIEDFQSKGLELWFRAGSETLSWKLFSRLPQSAT